VDGSDSNHDLTLKALTLKERRKTPMAMDIVLDLQKLEVPMEEDLLGSSTGSSVSGCCNGHQVDVG
jgi:hypothetical protein